MKWRAFVRSIRREAATTPPMPAAPATDRGAEPTEPGGYVCGGGRSGGCGYRFYRSAFDSPTPWMGPLSTGVDGLARWRSWAEVDEFYGDCVRHLVWEYRRMFQYAAALQELRSR
jgi:hypothetical protein